MEKGFTWKPNYTSAKKTTPSWAQHGMPALTDKFLALVLPPNSGDRHLDIGCGNGVKTVNFAAAGLTTVGIDLIEEGLAHARTLAKEKGLTDRTEFIQSSCLQLPFPAASISSASDILCFTHLTREESDRYITEVSRVLQPGGYMLMVLFSDKDEHFHGHPVTKEYNFRYDDQNPHMKGFAHYDGMLNVHYDLHDIEKRFGDHFTILETREVVHPVYSHRKLWNVILQKPRTS